MPGVLTAIMDNILQTQDLLISLSRITQTYFQFLQRVTIKTNNHPMLWLPSTAKNGLSIGASTTSSIGEVANFSANGYSKDGRVKPDLVAPGVLICSGRAQEAAIAIGGNCGSGTHANGNGMYMTLSGTSQATAVAGGSISLIREYLREEVGISSPTSLFSKRLQ